MATVAATTLSDNSAHKVLKFTSFSLTTAGEHTAIIDATGARHAVIYAVTNEIADLGANPVDAEMNLRAVNFGGTTRCPVRPYTNMGQTGSSAGDISAEQDVATFDISAGSDGNSVGSCIVNLPTRFQLILGVVASSDDASTAWTCDLYVELHT